MPGLTGNFDESEHPTLLFFKTQEIQMTKIFTRLMMDDSGATAIEYGLIASLIAVAIISGATSLGSALNTKFANLATNVKNGK